MQKIEKILTIQAHLDKQQLDGWLLYDFRRSNPLAVKILNISPQAHLTRRLFYWIPQIGVPVKLVHRIESRTLDHLPGKMLLYSTWMELEQHLKEILKDAKSVAMEYSSNNEIPEISYVDGGTIDLIRHCGGEVVSSQDLVQAITAALDEAQIESHFLAVKVLEEAVAAAWKLIAERLAKGHRIDEYSVQQFLLDYFKAKGCITDGPPICAVNAHAADPHYMPASLASSEIRKGDFILIDLWCKLDRPHSIYGDITKVAVAASAPTERQQEIFEIVKAARDKAIAIVKERFSKNCRIEGWEVDQAARDVIASKGYASYFIHRTGRNIDEEIHGFGANMDNYETHDARQIIPGSCFSIEPGIYLSEEFGVRLECDLLVDSKGEVYVTGDLQQKIECL